MESLKRVAERGVVIASRHRHTNESCVLHLAHVNGQTTTSAAAANVDDDCRSPDGRQPSLLLAPESAAARARVRRFRRGAMCDVSPRRWGGASLPPGLFFGCFELAILKESISGAEHRLARSVCSLSLARLPGRDLGGKRRRTFDNSRTRRVDRFDTHRAVVTWVLRA